MIWESCLIQDKSPTMKMRSKISFFTSRSEVKVSVESFSDQTDLIFRPTKYRSLILTFVHRSHNLSKLKSIMADYCISPECITDD